jgi:hypothetical protein
VDADDQRASSGFPGIRYGSGSEHSPVDPFGSCLLEVEQDGGVRLTNLRRGSARKWKGRLDSPARGELAHAAEQFAAHLPEPVTILVPDSSLRRLSIESMSLRLDVEVPWHEGAKTPLFRILDEIVVELSGGHLPLVTARGSDRLAERGEIESVDGGQ